MPPDLALAIDVGTGSARAALVDGQGRIVSMAAREHEQIVPRFGWAEQRPADWWEGVVHGIRAVLADVADAATRISAIAACGQMHGTVLIDGSGRLTRDTVPLWNDKRTSNLVRAFERANPPASYLAECGNPATPAWSGFKLAWLRDHDPDAYARAAAVLMPKDYINFRLTGECAMDVGDGSCSFLMSPTSRNWSQAMIARLGLDAAKLPPLRAPLDILGAITATAAAETGLRPGTPVLVGGGDFPVALLGSGVIQPGLAAEIAGTSSILTVLAREPLRDLEISNMRTVEGNWAAFALLESGGDALRWARRVFHRQAAGYEAIVALAAEAPAGSDALFFMPYLTGDRLGEHRNARAQFFGIGAAHGMSHMLRAILEGVAFAGARHLSILEKASDRKIERVIASAGGAKSSLWLKIKASVYGLPLLVPGEPECGVIGCAILVATATGRFARIEDAVAAYVRYAGEVMPDPAWSATYRRMQPVFDRLHAHAQALYDDLDGLIGVSRPPSP